ncbi:MAG: thiamine ABC transporter substrate-binding protein [bacterium]
MSSPAAARAARRFAPLAALLFAVSVLGGCLEPPTAPERYVNLDGYKKDPSGLDPNAWPNLDGTTITLLDNGAFEGFDVAATQFHDLTGVTVVKENGGDGVKSLKTLADSKASGKYDVIYGLDNMLLGKAIRQGVLEPYRPAMVNRIAPSLMFFPQNGTFYATPVDHGYVAINVDTTSAALEGQPVLGLGDVRHFADQFVTEDPTLSTPGLAFLLTTIAVFGEKSQYSPQRYDWQSYWTDLLTGRDTDRDHDGQVAGCVLVVDDWSTAYVQHFSAGYGVDGGGLADKPIVTSYTESPAVEDFYYRGANNGEHKPNLAAVVLEANATFHQIQTMAIAKGTTHGAAAQAWIEFSLTDFFQKLAAEKDGVYPVVPSIKVSSIYQGIDPTPGSFHDASMSYDVITANLERWLKEWTTLHEAHATCPV